MVIIFHFCSNFAQLCRKKAVPLQPIIVRTCAYAYIRTKLQVLSVKTQR